MTDPQMLIVRQGVNEIIEKCAQAAERGGPDAVRKLKVEESDDVPPKPQKSFWPFTADETQRLFPNQYPG